MTQPLKIVLLCHVLVLAVFPAAAFGQSQSTQVVSQLGAEDDEQATSSEANGAGEAKVGRIGQRLGVEDKDGPVAPLMRIESRINNRVENRIRLRLDRNYVPRENAANPIEIARGRIQSGPQDPIED